MQTIYGNYGKLLSEKKGVSYFYMFSTKTTLPFKSDSNTFFCTGQVPEYNMGYPLTLFGEWKKSQNGKWKFVISDFKEDITSGTVLADYLINECDGIGKIAANKIIALGEEIWALVKKEFAVDELHEITKISKKQCKSIISVLLRKEERYNLFKYLCQYGISDIKVDKIIEYYGNGALSAIKSNPYQILNQLNVPFYIADEIGFYENIDPFNIERIKGLFYYVLNGYTGDGSTWGDIHKIYEKIQQVSEKSVYKTKIPNRVLSVILKDIKWIYIDCQHNRLYFKEIWERECDIANGLARLSANSFLLNIDFSMINNVEHKLKINYAKGQKNAFHILDDTSPKVLTGGPGTGKTTTINGIINMYKEKYPYNTIALCAPTGTASEHMADTTGLEASTIHKLIDYRPYDSKGSEASYKDSDNPILADFIIVDESSMGDTKLMGMLLNAIKNGTLVLFCGDADQIDSVGYGSVFRDIINSGLIPVYRLTTLFRQKEDSDIIYNALRINDQNNDLRLSNNFNVYRYHNDDELKDLFTDFMEREPNLCNWQILTTTKKNVAGTFILNSLYQKNIIYTHRKTIHRNGYVFHKGDKIMTIINNYDAGYFNGDIGFISDITEMGTITIQLKNRVIHMEHSWIEDIVPAYAITIHKSQGSEYPNALIVLPKNPSILLQKNLLYTAVTRAKESITIFSQDDALEIAILNDKRKQKRTGLINKIEKAFT